MYQPKMLGLSSIISKPFFLFLRLNDFNTRSLSAAEICYCSTQEHPPIPPPVSSEERAQQIAEELTMDTSNTSAAQRKLISAEDNRPSAVGVG